MSEYVGDKVQDCEHDHVVFKRDIVKFNDTPLRRHILAGECMRCGSRMQFVGIPHDRPAEEPSTTPDALEVHIPFMWIAPGARV